MLTWILLNIIIKIILVFIHFTTLDNTPISIIKFETFVQKLTLIKNQSNFTVSYV